MAIPEGYRLLTANDVGKTFGEDLESVVYFDTSITSFSFSNAVVYDIYFNNSTSSYIQFYYNLGMNDYVCDISYGAGTGTFDYIFNQFESGSSQWLKSSLDLSNSTISSISSIEGTFVNNWLYVKDIQTATPKEQFISDMNSLGKSITDKAGASGKKSITELKDLVDNLKTTFTGQEKTVTPSKTSQVITPDSGYDGLSKVTVNVIPSSYIIPSGTLEISENGTKDVTQYASVNVNIQPTYWDGTYIEEELASGYTLTLITTVSSHAELYYSLDNGATYTGTGTSEFNITLENVNQIKFKAGAGYYLLGISNENSESLIYQMIHGSEVEFENITITKDTALTVTYGTYNGGSGD